MMPSVCHQMSFGVGSGRESRVDYGYVEVHHSVVVNGVDFSVGVNRKLYSRATIATSCRHCRLFFQLFESSESTMSLSGGRKRSFAGERLYALVLPSSGGFFRVFLYRGLSVVQRTWSREQEQERLRIQSSWCRHGFRPSSFGMPPLECKS